MSVQELTCNYLKYTSPRLAGPVKLFNLSLSGWYDSPEDLEEFWHKMRTIYQLGKEPLVTGTKGSIFYFNKLH